MTRLSPPATMSQASVPPGGPVWHTLDPAGAARQVDSDLERGLTEAEASRRLAQDGPNQLAEPPGKSVGWILIAQFRNLVVYLLMAAAVLAVLSHEYVEAAAVLVVIVVNALIGFFTEWRADQALAALRRQVVPEAHVVRDGRERVIPAAELVAGDLVSLAAGARVPADGRVVLAQRLQIDEAPLTGESHPVRKQVEPVAAADTTLGDRLDMAYLGTTVTDGRGQLLVTATGPRTEMGRIGTLIEQSGAEATPLEQKLEEMGRTLILAVLALCVVIVAAGLIRGIALLTMLETGISLAIAAVPEGLPAVATMTLAIGMQRMARMRALIRRLPAVETLGSTSVICTDKTGTLTRSEMTAQALVLGERQLGISGVGYAPQGMFEEQGRTLDPQADPLLMQALRIGVLCSDARVERTPENAERVIGDPTEAALIVAAEKAGLDPLALRPQYPRVHEIPFDSLRMWMATVHRTPEGRVVAYFKGAPAAVLDACTQRATAGEPQPLTADERAAALAANEELAGRALRVLALACRDLPAGSHHDEAELARDLVYVGLVGMIDPLRTEAAEAIGVCRQAGIRAVMITGDQQATAAEIARQLGLDRDAQGRTLRVVHGRDLEGLDEASWDRLVSEASVYARVSPEHKLQIVEALKRRGETVAMTGDGVNDAPALKRADIGVAMGIKGTEVAKETADMIVTDDNFATIVSAVEQGRIIYANIQKFIHYLFACNSAEVLCVFVAILAGLPLPLVPLQILWMNMVTDVLPALALAVEPSAPQIMRRPPRARDDRLLDRAFLIRVGWQGLLLALASLAALLVGLAWYGRDEAGVAHARTLGFMALCLAQIFHSLNCRSRTRSIFSAQMFSNLWLWAAIGTCLVIQTGAVTLPLLRRVLQTVPPSPLDFVVVTGFALMPVVVVELVKWFGRRREAGAVRT